MSIRIDGGSYQPIGPIRPPATPRVEEPAIADSQPSSFGQQVKDAIDNVNTLQSKANEIAEQVSSGNPEDAHKAVIAMEHSLMALDFTLQMRNKMLEAYQEIMRMQI